MPKITFLLTNQQSYDRVSSDGHLVPVRGLVPGQIRRWNTAHHGAEHIQRCLRCCRVFGIHSFLPNKYGIAILYYELL